MNFRCLLAILVVLPLFSCNSSRSVEEGVTKTESGYLIRPQWELNDTYHLTSSISETTSARNSPQGDWSMENQITRTYQVSVSGDKANSSKHTATLKRIQVLMDNGMGFKDSFDSQAPKGSQIDQYFMPQIGGEMVVTYDPLFKATEVELEGKVAEAMMWLKNADYSVEEWTRERRLLDAVFPESQLKPGTEWQDTHIISSFYPVRMQRNFKVVADKGGIIAIQMDGTATAPETRYPTMEMGMKMDYELAGMVTGIYKIDLGKGRLLSATTTFDLQGSCFMLGGDSTITFPITINQTVSNRYKYN